MRTAISRASIAFIAVFAVFALTMGVQAGSVLARGSENVSAAQAVLKPSPHCAKLVQSKVRKLLAVAHTSRAAQRIHGQRRMQLMQRCLRAEQRANKRPARAGASSVSPGNLVIGIDGGYSAWNSDEVEMRAELGAAVTRHEWDPSEPVDDQDEIVYDAAAKVHTRIHALLGANELGSASHYSEWVVAFIRRYGEGGSFWAEHPELDASRYAIKTFELGNEPYYGGMSATEYAETVRPTLEAVHNAGLPAQLVLPSVIFGTDTSWMDTLYKTIPNLNALFYAFADHPYWYGHSPAESGNNDSPLDRIAELRKRMNEQGASTKPILITEYGESTADCGEECVSEAEQAEHLQLMLSGILSHPEWGVKMISFFQLHDWGTDSSDREQQFGLIKENGTPKPAYSIVESAMQQYRG